MSKASANGRGTRAPCPVSREEFRAQAAPVAVSVGGQSLVAAPKEFSTGSLGWNINDKVTVEIAGKSVTVQIGLNLTIVGSKELPKDAGAPAASDGEAP